MELVVDGLAGGSAAVGGGGLGMGVMPVGKTGTSGVFGVSFNSSNLLLGLAGVRFSRRLSLINLPWLIKSVATCDQGNGSAGGRGLKGGGSWYWSKRNPAVRMFGENVGDRSGEQAFNKTVLVSIESSLSSEKREVWDWRRGGNERSFKLQLLSHCRVLAGVWGEAGTETIGDTVAEWFGLGEVLNPVKIGGDFLTVAGLFGGGDLDLRRRGGEC